MRQYLYFIVGKNEFRKELFVAHMLRVHSIKAFLKIDDINQLKNFSSTRRNILYLGEVDNAFISEFSKTLKSANPDYIVKVVFTDENAKLPRRLENVNTMYNFEWPIKNPPGLNVKTKQSTGKIDTPKR